MSNVDHSRAPLLDTTTGSSFIKACFNLTNAFLGIGLLTVPYALSNGGWLSLLLFFAISIISFYTGILLKRCMEINPSIRNYLDIAQHAFGKTWKVFIIIIMNCELYLVAIGLLIMEGDNLYKLFPEFGIYLGPSLMIPGRESFVILTGLVILPTMLLTDLGILSYVSATGVFSCLIILVSVICVGFFDGVGFDDKGSLLNFTRIPTSISLYVVCFAGHLLIPSVYTSMRHPQKFTMVLMISFIIVTLMSVLMGIAGYLMYGDTIESQITLNLPTSSIAGNVAIYTTLLIPITRYALTLTPVANALESVLPESRKKSKIIKRVIRLALLTSSMVFACLFPHFGSLMSIVGSVFIVLACFVLPCLCYLKLSESYRSWSFKLVGIVGIVVFAVVAGALGTHSTIAEIIQDK